eukprot:TRINITY_DN1220_c0_g1_i7.p2 TRINITY_DN1220_c0_g1~~TRINITY_DN1220_c0_g1_i7.p2  ORF type:complete len:234 (-),score=44.10 TRINITY_DN1220_c0_g1_i7:906-1607(-)
MEKLYCLIPSLNDPAFSFNPPNANSQKPTSSTNYSNQPIYDTSGFLIFPYVRETVNRSQPLYDCSGFCLLPTLEGDPSEMLKLRQVEGSSEALDVRIPMSQTKYDGEEKVQEEEKVKAERLKEKKTDDTIKAKVETENPNKHEVADVEPKSDNELIDSQEKKDEVANKYSLSKAKFVTKENKKPNGKLPNNHDINPENIQMKKKSNSQSARVLKNLSKVQIAGDFVGKHRENS